MYDGNRKMSKIYTQNTLEFYFRIYTIWDEVAVHLNITEGPHKNGKEWAKVIYTICSFGIK